MHDVARLLAAGPQFPGVLGLDLEEYSDVLAGWGYPASTIGNKRRVLRDLAAWMSRTELHIADLDAPRIRQFVASRHRTRRPWRGVGHTVRQLLEHLRSTGALRRTVSVPDDSPTEVLLSRYEGYLRRERCLVDSTVTDYRRFARELITQTLANARADCQRLDAARVRTFLLRRARQLAPRRAQNVATALRSFLRFLFLHGHTVTDLSLAVPMVRQWRLSSVPRYLPAQQVEQLLHACDLSSATGRRNHAVLLLLARLGLRASEVVTLELEDLRWRQGEIVVHGKGGQVDRLPLPVEVGHALERYLRQDRPRCASRRVFVCRKAPHRGFGHPSTVTTIVGRTLARAGLTPPTRGAHLLRHSLATDLLRRGCSLAEIGQVLRHRSANTTEIYAKLDFTALRDVALPWPTTGGAS
jgi:site-specific recombinase XerD